MNLRKSRSKEPLILISIFFFIIVNSVTRLAKDTKTISKFTKNAMDEILNQIAEQMTEMLNAL